VVGLLGAIFTYAARRHMRTDNPVRGVVLFADGKRERRLRDGEYEALGNALREAEAASGPQPLLPLLGRQRLALRQGFGFAPE
jgi:hypothetical protein